MKSSRLLVILLLLSGCAKPLLEPVEPLPIEEMFTSPQSVEPHKSNWTTANKLWFTAAIAGQTSDVVSTFDALDSENCVEANPLLGSDAAIIGSKLLLFGATLWFTEYYYRDDPRQQKARNVIYGTLAAVGAGLGVWNYNQDCR